MDDDRPCFPRNHKMRNIYPCILSTLFLDYAPMKSDVVSWYLDEIQEEIESQDELTEKRAMVEKVQGISRTGYGSRTEKKRLKLFVTK